VIEVINNKYKNLDTNLIKTWVKEIIFSYNKLEGKVIINFINKRKMIELNLKFLNHNSHTDIITFDNCKKNEISGEIFISNYMLKENALKYRQTIDNEAIRLISHGVAHLLGFNDKTKKEKEKMTEIENNFIGMFHVKQTQNV
tara:strand:- start:44385 stop:44813 length:429 start_codon:yes stop_codon:yes gene_type:complete